MQKPPMQNIYIYSKNCVHIVPYFEALSNLPLHKANPQFNVSLFKILKQFNINQDLQSDKYSSIYKFGVSILFILFFL